MNFNDIWAITGIPVSPFDARDADVQVTGSGGVAMIVRLGSELIAEGRLTVGDLCTVYSGQSELLSPDQGLDPMAADFRIQGYGPWGPDLDRVTVARFVPSKRCKDHRRLSGLRRLIHSPSARSLRRHLSRSPAHRHHGHQRAIRGSR